MTNTNPNFAGDKKHGKWLLATYEAKLKKLLLPLVPKWVETYHLTLCTIPESLLIILFCWLAATTNNMQWLWGTSAMIFAQYITDLLDGAIGRQRNTGLIKWGFYMDHLLDYMFLCSIIIGYGILMPQEFHFMQFYVFALLTAFMVNSFLAFAATNQFKISYLNIGPTEIRLAFIAINTLLIIVGKTYIAPAAPYVITGSLLGLIVVAYSTGKELWQIDMEAKRQSTK